MGKGEEKQKSCFARFLHFMSCALLFVGGGLLLGYSIYLQVNDQGLIPGLASDGTDIVSLLLGSAIAGIIAGAALMVISLVGLLAFKGGCCGIVLKVVYVILLVVVLAVLVFIAVITLKFATGKDGPIIQDAALNSWQASVTNSEFTDTTCQIQQEYQCAGFFDNDCTGCDPSIPSTCTETQLMRCPVCNPDTDPSLPGCYTAVTDEYSSLYLPIGITSAVLGGFAVADMIAIWFV
ncbi:hypothetical protein NDN08_007675 [Rhodosorus marinus]|uniref:Tetraspanin n=1 Tax=Rhodosorus marinus TaxID=101924 RepID=A0AAV8UY82_9RHOD|nr:hypothetical protein NDN08_007675 [Rhodosorus marinus]